MRDVEILYFKDENSFALAAKKDDIILLTDRRKYTGNIDDYLLSKEKNPNLYDYIIKEGNEFLLFHKKFIHRCILEHQKEYPFIIVREK